MSATPITSAPVHDASRVAYLLGCQPIACEPHARCGFVTFYDPGWSIRRLHDPATNDGTIIPSQPWYFHEPFAGRTELPRYRQLRMTATADSCNKTFAEQQALLPADEEIPTARVVLMGMVIHFLATGERLFPEHWVRSVDRRPNGNHVVVGGFTPRGLTVVNVWDDDRSAYLGLAAARKC